MSRFEEKWRARAACRGRLDLEWFDPTVEQAKECRELCAGCPVLQQCRAEALASGEPWGIWGALDVDERARVAELNGHPAPVVKPPHGSNSRYAKHGCRCQPCRRSHAAYERERRARHQDRTGCVIADPPITAGGQYLLDLGQAG